MEHSVDLDGDHCSSRKRAVEDPPHGVPQSRSVSSFQRLYHELAVASIFVNDFCDRWLFNFYHYRSLLPFQVFNQLLGVQLDDKVLLNGSIDLFSLGKGKDLAFKLVEIYVHP